MTKHQNKKKALITGATGFVGSYLANRLCLDGWDVHVIIRPNSNMDSLKKILQNIVVHIHEGTTIQMISIFKTVKPDVVFHLASSVISQHETKDIEPIIQSNILFGTQLLEAMTVSGVYRLINTGTSWQHYENQPYNPVCLYAATKQAYEAILTYYVEVTPLNVVTLKLFDTYGPNDPRRKLIPLLQETAKNDKIIAMSLGEQLIDLVHIDDVVNAFLIAAERLMKDKVSQCEEYAVSSGNPLSLQEIVKMYEKVIGKNLLVKWGERPYRPREVWVPWNNGRKLPSWEPKINLVEGLENLYKEGVN